MEERNDFRTQEMADELLTNVVDLALALAAVLALHTPLLFLVWALRNTPKSDARGGETTVQYCNTGTVL